MKGIPVCSRTTLVMIVSVLLLQAVYLGCQLNDMQHYSLAFQNSVRTETSVAVRSNVTDPKRNDEPPLRLIDKLMEHNPILESIPMEKNNESALWIENQASSKPINAVDSYFSARNGDDNVAQGAIDSDRTHRHDTSKKLPADLMKNYFQAIVHQDGLFHHVASKLAPIQLVQKYMVKNSQQELEKMYKKCGANCFHQHSFIVGHYSCPWEAGNRIFQFMNTFLWALLTDRVFLWRYLDESVCESQAGTDVEPAENDENRTCETVVLNTPLDCSNILHLSDWVPSWDEWKLKLNLTEPVRAYVIGNGLHDEQYEPLDKDDNPRVIHVGPAKNLETGMKLSRNPRARPQLALMSKSSTRNNARQLFAQKMFFAYGMMFEALFTLDDSLLSPTSTTSMSTAAQTAAAATTTTTTTTIVHSFALHSRHSKEMNDGTDIKREISCMDRILRPLAKATAGATPWICIVYVMTDRQSSKTLLMSALKSFDYNCTPVLTTNITGGTSFRSEHGPFAGRGYFEDLALVIQARHGFLAPGTARRIQMQGIRTSSALPRSIIEFRRVLEAMSSFYSTTSNTTHTDTSGHTAMELVLPPFEECFA